MAIVYLARNRVNGRAYIGQTVKSLAVRRQGHEYDARNGKTNPFHKALRKYGTDAFEWSVLAEYPVEEIAAAEVKWIEQLRLQGWSLYNVTDGGEGGLPGFRHSDKSKEKNRQAHLGKKQSDETKARRAAKTRGQKRSTEIRQKMSEAQRRVDRSGRVVSEKTRQKQSALRRGKKHSEEHKAAISAAHRRHSRKYHFYTVSGEYVGIFSLLEFCEQRALDPKTIGNMCLGYKKSSYGFTAKEVEDDHDAGP